MDSLKNKIIALFNKVKSILACFCLNLFNAIKKVFGFNNKQKQIEFDKKLVFSLSKSRIPSLGQLKYIKRYLSKQEFWVVNACLIAIAGSLIFLGTIFYRSNRLASTGIKNQITAVYGSDF